MDVGDVEIDVWGDVRLVFVNLLPWHAVAGGRGVKVREFSTWCWESFSVLVCRGRELQT